MTSSGGEAWRVEVVAWVIDLIIPSIRGVGALSEDSGNLGRVAVEVVSEVLTVAEVRVFESSFIF